MMRSRVLAFCALAISYNAKAQLESFSHFRELSAPTATYSTIEIPQDVYAIAHPDLRDLRIFCLQANDTLEIPFIWNISNPAESRPPREAKLFNVGIRNGNYAFEFETDGSEIDRIDLSFGREEFDAPAALEGSMDGQTWTIIKDSQRLISINNHDLHYRYSSFTFPPARFSRYRVTLRHPEDHHIQQVTYRTETTQPEVYRNIDSVLVTIAQDRNTKETILTLDYDRNVPLAGLRFIIEQRDNFLRPILIRGYRKQRTGTMGYSELVWSQAMTLSSWETLEYKLHFNPEVVDSLVAVIRNFDDQPLNIQSVESFSDEAEVIARTQDEGRYILAYGHKDLYSPTYDLEHFRNRLGTDIGRMEAGVEQHISNNVEPEQSTVNQGLLWIVIVVAIVLIGLFTKRMMLPKE